MFIIRRENSSKRGNFYSNVLTENEYEGNYRVFGAMWQRGWKASEERVVRESSHGDKMWQSTAREWEPNQGWAPAGAHPRVAMLGKCPKTVEKVVSVTNRKIFWCHKTQHWKKKL